MIYPLPISTVTAAIKTLLVVTGVQVWDMSDLANTVLGRDCPILFPEVRNGFVNSWEIGPQSVYGAEGQGVYDTKFVLEYTLAFAPVGADRSLYAVMPEMHDLIMSIVYGVTLHERLGGLVVYFHTVSIEGNGLVMDPDGNQFYGKTFHFQIAEYIG